MKRTKLPMLYNSGLILLFGVLLTACGNKTEQDPPPIKKVITLSNANISKFKRNFTSDYISKRNALLDKFKTSKESNDGKGFNDYRNFHWTPEYIKQQHYYEAVLETNIDYIDQVKLKPLLDTYTNLVFISLDLKKALLHNDNESLKSAYKAIKADHITIKRYQK